VSCFPDSQGERGRYTEREFSHWRFGRGDLQGLSQTRGRFAVAVVELGVLVTATESSTLSDRNRLTLFQRESGVSSPPLSLC
jgi:hypothetical protein